MNIPIVEGGKQQDSNVYVAILNVVFGMDFEDTYRLHPGIVKTLTTFHVPVPR
jgi:hypothetical protein